MVLVHNFDPNCFPPLYSDLSGVGGSFRLSDVTSILALLLLYSEEKEKGKKEGGRRM